MHFSLMYVCSLVSTMCQGKMASRWDVRVPWVNILTVVTRVFMIQLTVSTWKSINCIATYKCRNWKSDLIVCNLIMQDIAHIFVYSFRFPKDSYNEHEYFTSWSTAILSGTAFFWCGFYRYWNVLVIRMANSEFNIDSLYQTSV